MRGKHWWVLALLVLSVIINYIDRGNLSIAAPVLTTELSLSATDLGLLLASFFWTYALLQLLGIAGWLADRFDVTLVLGAGLFLWSGATAATGAMTTLTGLFVMRLVLGAGESLAYPCYSKILARYFREDRRGLANALIDAGTKIGPALGTLAGGLLLARVGWRLLFVVVGGGGLLWLVPWFIFRPRRLEEERSSAAPMPGIGAILRQRAAWGTTIGHFCGNYFWYFLLTWLPLYLVRERGLSIEAMATIGSLAYATIAAATVVAGWLADRWISRGASASLARKTMTVAGLLCATVIFPVAIIRDRNAAIALLLVSCLSYGTFASSHWAITQTLAGPLAAGRWTSLQNGVANLSGVIAPWLTGWVVERTGTFVVPFVVAAAVAFVGASMYAFVVGPVAQVSFEPPRIPPVA